MLVGQIAWEKLTPAARQQTTELVRTLETIYNEGQTYNVVTAGCWMDDMRSEPDYAWSKWHYVNIPWTQAGTPCELSAEGPNVVWAINENLKTLRDPAAALADRSLAVAMLLHFVGDIHQPLHATERNDRGGNGFLIHGVPFSDLWPGTIPNLHAYWDKGYAFDRGGAKIVETWKCPPIAGRPKAPGDGPVAEEAAKIMQEFPPEALPQLADPATAAAWARESHVIGCLAGYPLGPQPGSHEVVELSPDFAQKVGQIARQRVALAGYRLANLLNELFK